MFARMLGRADRPSPLEGEPQRQEPVPDGPFRGEPFRWERGEHAPPTRREGKARQPPAAKPDK